MAKQAGKYTEISLDLQGDIDGIDCCSEPEVRLELSVDGEIVYESGVVDAMGVELTVRCPEHSAETEG